VSAVRFDRQHVNPSFVLSLLAELARCNETAEQPTCLVWAKSAQFGSLLSGDLGVYLDVLEDHLLLLEWFETMHTDVAGRRVQHPVDRCGQMPVPCLALASGAERSLRINSSLRVI